MVHDKDEGILADVEVEPSVMAALEALEYVRPDLTWAEIVAGALRDRGLALMRDPAIQQMMKLRGEDA
jgi:hypothetical protein